MLKKKEGCNLPSLLEYQSGSIVSKTLIKNSSCNITLFAFDRGEKLSEHSSPFNAYVWVVEGELAVTIGEERVSVRAGNVLLMPATVPHALDAIEPSKMLLTMIKQEE